MNDHFWDGQPETHTPAIYMLTGLNPPEKSEKLLDFFRGDSDAGIFNWGSDFI